jgi:hypothetical protein
LTKADDLRGVSVDGGEGLTEVEGGQRWRADGGGWTIGKLLMEVL